MAKASTGLPQLPGQLSLGSDRAMALGTATASLSSCFLGAFAVPAVSLARPPTSVASSKPTGP